MNPGPPVPENAGTFDVHAHAIPPAVIATLERDGGRYGIEIIDRDGSKAVRIAGSPSVSPLRPDLSDVAHRLAAMDAGGVDVQLVSSWIGVTAYSLPGRDGARYARMFNNSLAQMVAENADRFLGLCTVPLQAPDLAAAELRHAVTALGMVGVEIATTVNGHDLDDPGLEPFWEAAAGLRCLVLLHPDQVLPGRSAPRYFLNNLVGNAAETTIALAHVLCSGVLERHPDLRLCVVHGGGYLPYQAGRMDRGYAAKPGLVGPTLSRPPSAYLRRLYFDTVTHSPHTLRFLIDFAGPDRVVLGSDYPFEMGDDTPVASVTAVPELDDSERELILHGNVRRLLREVRHEAENVRA